MTSTTNVGRKVRITHPLNGLKIGDELTVVAMDGDPYPTDATGRDDKGYFWVRTPAGEPCCIGSGAEGFFEWVDEPVGYAEPWAQGRKVRLRIDCYGLLAGHEAHVQLDPAVCYQPISPDGADAQGHYWIAGTRGTPVCIGSERDGIFEWADPPRRQGAGAWLSRIDWTYPGWAAAAGVASIVAGVAAYHLAQWLVYG